MRRADCGTPGAEGREKIAPPPVRAKESAMSKGLDLSKAMQYRHHAAACGLFAASARLAADPELLLYIERPFLLHAPKHRDPLPIPRWRDPKSTRLKSNHQTNSDAYFSLQKKKTHLFPHS